MLIMLMVAFISLMRCDEFCVEMTNLPLEQVRDFIALIKTRKTN